MATDLNLGIACHQKFAHRDRAGILEIKRHF
jgi:hypothetical protein